MIQLELKNVPVFAFLSAEQIKRLPPIAKTVSKQQGEAVLMSGEEAKGIYVVGEGTVGVYPGKSANSLVEIGAGGSFGEMSFMEETTASATIRANSVIAKLGVFFHVDLKKLCDEDPSFAASLYQGIACNLSQKLRTTNSRITDALTEGRALLATLNEEPREEARLDSVDDWIDESVQDILNQFGACEEKLQELTEKIPDKPGTIGELTLAMSDAQNRFRRFGPFMADRVKLMAEFIRSVEKFLTFSSG